MSSQNRSSKKDLGWEVEVYSKTIDQEKIDYINNNISLKSLLNNYKIILEEKYSPSGWTHKGCCPFPDHSDSNPSFNYNSIEDRFFCFGCSKSGRAVQFVSYIEKISIDKSIDKLIKLLGNPEDIKFEIENAYDNRIDDKLFEFSEFIKEKLKNNPNKISFIETCTWALDVFLENSLKDKKKISYEGLSSRIDLIKKKLISNLKERT